MIFDFGFNLKISFTVSKTLLLCVEINIKSEVFKSNLFDDARIKSGNFNFQDLSLDAYHQICS